MKANYLQDKVDYIDTMSQKMGGKGLLAMGEIQKSQLDLTALLNKQYFSAQPEGNMMSKLFYKLQDKIQYLSDKLQIETAIAYMKKMYGISDKDIAEVQSQYRFSSDM